LFFTKPVVGSTKWRGSLWFGAERISDTTLRSTEAFVGDFVAATFVVDRTCGAPVGRTFLEDRVCSSAVRMTEFR